MPELSAEQIEAAVALGQLTPAGEPDRDELVARYAELIASPEARARLAGWAADDELDPVAAQARELLLPGTLIAERQFLQVPRQWPYVFWRCLSTQDEPQEWGEMAYTGLPLLRLPGERAAYDSGIGKVEFRYRIEPQEVALAVRIPAARIADGSYFNAFRDAALGLGESFVQAEEILHANVLNIGMVYNPAIVGDGVSLFSAEHPYRHGTYSNRADFGLNEASLEESATRIRRFHDFTGLRMLARPRTLIVPVQLEYAAHRLLKGMAEDKSPAAPSEGYRVLDYLENPQAWFLLTTVRSLVSVERKPYRLDISIDGADLLLEASQAYGVGHRNPRGCFGSFPAAQEKAA